LLDALFSWVYVCVEGLAAAAARIRSVT
jgi:hypothetical protein